MIVKDEEKFLPQCLDSVKDHVDEIIVVDTGSTDKTVEIVESYGARVYHHPWENHFSKHRNQSISYATGDWILIMDADEKLDAETVSLVRKAVNKAPTAVITFNVRSYLENGSYYSEGSSPRLFKNGFGFHYQGYVHNQLVLKDKVTPSSIVLWHYGYDLSPDQLDAKQQRSLKLLEKQIQEFPEDLPTRHHLAMTLLACKQYEEACQEAKLAIDKMEARGVTDPHFAWTYFVAASALMKLDSFDEADALCLKALETFSWSIDLHHCLSQIKFVKKEYEKVLEHGHEFFRLREELRKNSFQVQSFQFETIQRDWVIYRSMGYSHLYLGDHDKGIDLLKKAIDRVPECDVYPLAEEIGSNLTKLKKWEKAIWFLEKSAKKSPDLVKCHLNSGLFYFKQNDYVQARAHLENYMDDFSENIYLLLALSKAYLETGEIEAMIGVCEKILRCLNLPVDVLIESISQVAELFVDIAGKLLEEKRFDSFEIALDMIKHLDPESTGGLKRLSQLAFNLNEPVRGANILEIVLAIDPKDPEILSLMQDHIKALET